jgi:predicted transcriptional regulator
MDIKEYIKDIVREIISEDELDEMSVSANAGGYTPIMMVSKNKEGSPAALQAAEDEGFTKVKSGIPSDSKVFDYKQITGKKPKTYKMYETIDKIVKEGLLNEGTYSKFKNEVKLRSKNEQLHKAIKEVKRKLMEIDRIVEYTSMMKQELSEGEEGLKYWKTTEANVSRISEMVNNLNTKIQNLQQ